MIHSGLLENPRRKTERGLFGKWLLDSKLAATGICVRVPPVDLGARKSGENLPDGPYALANSRQAQSSRSEEPSKCSPSASAAARMAGTSAP